MDDKTDKITIGEPVLTRYERARIVGARALQISHGAPLLIEVEGNDFRPHDVANRELKSRSLPIGLSRRLPNGRPQVIPIQYLADREFIAQIKIKDIPSTKKPAKKAAKKPAKKAAKKPAKKAAKKPAKKAAKKAAKKPAKKAAKKPAKKAAKK